MQDTVYTRFCRENNILGPDLFFENLQKLSCKYPNTIWDKAFNEVNMLKHKYVNVAKGIETLEDFKEALQSTYIEPMDDETGIKILYFILYESILDDLDVEKMASELYKSYNDDYENFITKITEALQYKYGDTLRDVYALDKKLKEQLNKKLGIPKVKVYDNSNVVIPQIPTIPECPEDN